MKKIILTIFFLGHISVVLLSSLVLCIYIEPLLRVVGFCPSNPPNLLLLWLSLGLAIVSMELIFRALLQLIFASPMNQTNFVDAISYIPFTFFLVGDFLLTHFHITLPPLLKSIVIISSVMALHCGMKLLSLFSAIFGKPSSRLFFLLWVIPILLSLYISVVATIKLNNSILIERIFMENNKAEDGNKKTITNKIMEGGLFLTQLKKSSCKELVFFLKPTKTTNITSPIYIYMFSLDEKEFPLFKKQVQTYSTSEWQEISITCDSFIPESTLLITWSSYKLPDWIVKKGLIPTISLTSYLELKSFILNPQPYTSATKKYILLLGPYEIQNCED